MQARISPDTIWFWSWQRLPISFRRKYASKILGNSFDRCRTQSCHFVCISPWLSSLFSYIEITQVNMSCSISFSWSGGNWKIDYIVSCLGGGKITFTNDHHLQNHLCHWVYTFSRFEPEIILAHTASFSPTLSFTSVTQNISLSVHLKWGNFACLTDLLCAFIYENIFKLNNRILWTESMSFYVYVPHSAQWSWLRPLAAIAIKY